MKNLTKLFLCFVIWGILVCNANAQPPLENWFFGQGAKVGNMSSASPIATSVATINTLEGSSSISDSNGNLLFYTDGRTVWNKYNAVMPNGSGLMGNSSSTTSSLIVPCDCNKYFIFTTDAAENSYLNGLRYSVVDMNYPGSSGNGGVELPTKNTLLLLRSTEKIAAVAAAPNGGFWVVAHELGTNRFFSYRIQANSNCTINPQSEQNRISAVGSVYNLPPHQNGTGQMKISPDGTKLAIAGGSGPGNSFIEVFNFNTTTGMVSNLNGSSITVREQDTVAARQGFYGVEFSPDGNQLYVSTIFTNNRIYQYELTGANSSNFTTTKKELVVALGTPPSTYDFGELQLSPIGTSPQKIYIARRGKNYISAINFPNNSVATATGFTNNSITLASGSQSTLGLPAMVAGNFTCGATQENCCDQMKVTPFTFLDINQSWRTFEFYNLKYPASDICSIDIAFSSPTPGNFRTGGQLKVWDGNNLNQLNGSPWWTPPYDRVPITGTIAGKPSSPTQPSVMFNLGIDRSIPWTGSVTFIVRHCDGSTCTLRYNPWINTQTQGGGNPTGVMPWKYNIKDLSAELVEVTLTYEGGRERLRLPEGGKGAKWLGLRLKDESKEIYSIDGTQSSEHRRDSKKFSLSGSSKSNNVALFEFSGLLNLGNRELNGQTITFLVKKKSDQKIEPKEIILTLFDENSNEIIVGNPR